MAASQRAVALVDSSKIGRQALITCASYRDFEAVIVDDAISEANRDALLAAGVPLEVAPAT